MSERDHMRKIFGSHPPLSSALVEQAKQEDEDWKTIRAILETGGSLPFDLQRKYDRHMEEIHIGLKALAKE